MIKNLWSFQVTAKIKYAIIAVLFSILLVSHAGATQTDSKEYERFGRHVVAALSDGDTRTFDQAIDKEALLARVFEGVSQDSKKLNELRAGFTRGLNQTGATMTSNLAENALLTFVRHRRMHDENYALMRIDFGEKGLNYLDFVLHKDRTGSVKIIDWHDYAQGQLLTESLRQAIFLLFPQDKTLFEKLLSVHKLNKKEVKQFIEMARLLKQQQYVEWFEKYDALPKKLKYSRILLVRRLQMASAVGEKNQYRLALEDIHKHLGDDPTLSLVLMDYYFLTGDYRAAQKALEKLAEYTGGDAAIDHLRANVYLVQKNYSESMRYSQMAIEQDDAYEGSYWTLLEASVLAKKYQIAVSVIEQIERQFGYEFNPAKLAKIEEYKEFVKSDAFAKWKGAR